jgi:hypothetical protein
MDGPPRILSMARDCWVENLKCANCRKTGAARFSAEDKYSWDFRVDSVPEGFKVTHSSVGPNLLLLVVQYPCGTLSKVGPPAMK